MSTSPPNLVLLDNTVLSDFAEVKREDIVFSLWKTCTTTPDAWRELQAGIAFGHLSRIAWKTLPVTELTDSEQELASRLSNTLGAGERSCIAKAVKRTGLFGTDDRKARQVALELGVKVTGTLGILVVAVERQITLLDKANQYLAQMIRNGYRSPVDDLSSLLS
jgi:predicted nucleic acid-binding protein